MHSQDALTDSATLLSRSLFALATNASLPQAVAAIPPSFAADRSFVAELVGCFAVDARCALFAEAIGVQPELMPRFAPEGAARLYAGVFSAPQLNGNGYNLRASVAEIAVRHFLANATTPFESRNGSCADRRVRCGPDYPCAPPFTARLPPPTAPFRLVCLQAMHSKPIPGTNYSDSCVCFWFGQCGSQGYECLFDQCMQATAYYHDAVSPALVAQGSGQWEIDEAARTKYSDAVWTEP